MARTIKKAGVGSWFLPKREKQGRRLDGAPGLVRTIRRREWVRGSHPSDKNRDVAWMGHSGCGELGFGKATAKASRILRLTGNPKVAYI